MPQLPEVTWTPGTQLGLAYEKADACGRNLLVYQSRIDLFYKVNVDGNAREGDYLTVVEAKAAAVASLQETGCWPGSLT